jgi:hypothetical protein
MQRVYCVEGYRGVEQVMCRSKNHRPAAKNSHDALRAISISFDEIQDCVYTVARRRRIFVHDSQSTSPAIFGGVAHPTLATWAIPSRDWLRPRHPSVVSTAFARTSAVSETVRGRWFGHLGQNLTTAANELDSVLGNAFGRDLTARLLTVAITSSNQSTTSSA